MGMDWEEIAILTIFVTSFILMVLTAITLVKAWRETRYKVVMWVIGLLLAANVGYFVSSIAGYE